MLISIHDQHMYVASLYLKLNLIAISLISNSGLFSYQKNSCEHIVLSDIKQKVEMQ